ncbi:NADPH-dependent FMN reductase [Natronococcus wangiae]|uniref:NADPH-dependent FMN reductase n=1 Tax=Natronococcus wangiae TaxID=3068275 RepID=UPI00273E75F2|nr:NAD(P)H-dependent oxidoreductase [Natronococcus sp. AD5]
MNAFERAGRSSGEERPRVVAVSGSRREGSYTRLALKEALSGVEAVGGTAEVLDLSDVDLPTLDPDVDAAKGGDTVRRTIREADAVILGTPTYHGSYSGVVKNALDYCGFDEFENTTIGLLAVSGGPFPAPALDHLRAVCRSLRAWVLPYQAAIPRARTAFNDAGFVDEDLRERARTLGVRTVEYASIEPVGARALQFQEV